MSTSFLSSKKKRPRTSSEPNQSFVKNVTSRVSSFLPTTITKWFSNASSSNTNGSTQVADATDSSTEDEAPDSPDIKQPPAKKMRYSPPGNYQYSPVETKCKSTNTESVNEPDNVESSKEKSNFDTHLNSSNSDTTDQSIQDSSFFKTQHSLSAVKKSTDRKRKSLFDTQDDFYKKRSHMYSGNVRDPYFKPSLLSSPFYVGRTMYGGASSSYMYSTPQSVMKRKVYTNETNNTESVTMSHSARRVMDLLEHYSSPLTEAKRIPQVTRNPKKNISNNSFQQSVNPYTPKVFSYKTQELYIPTVASILTIKRKSRLMDTTNAARQIIASHSSSSPEFVPYSKIDSDGDALDEVKSRTLKTIHGQNIEMDTVNSDTVMLPNVILQLDKDNLPKFTYGPTLTSQASKNSSIYTSVKAPDLLKRTSEFNKSDSVKLKDVEKDKPLEVENEDDCYKFSTPVQVSSDSNKNSILTKFSFGSPERNVEQAQENKIKDNQFSFNMINKKNTDNKIRSHQNSSDWNCLDCGLKNHQDVSKCVSCGGKRPIEIDDSTKKCSMCNLFTDQPECDKCTECEKKTNNWDRLIESKGNTIAEGKCNYCLSDSNGSADKCVCGGEKNPKKILLNNSFDSEWKCNDCWIKNKNILTKCAACGGARPGSKVVGRNFGSKSLLINSQGAKEVKETKDSMFKTIAKAQSEKWECQICFVRNESNRTTCVCCEANKPGTEKECGIPFNFHQPSEITFKFGIQLKQQQACTDIEPEECNMGEESETNNNILPKTPTFNFGVPSKEIDYQSSFAGAPKMNFTFGAINQDPVTPIKNIVFGIPSKLTETSGKTQEKEELQRVPQMFAPPTLDESLNNNKGSEIPVPVHHLNQISNVKNDTPFSTTSAAPTTSSEGNSQQSNFAFPTIIPATNMFAPAPTSTIAASSNVLPAPLSMNVPATSTMPLFEQAIVVTTTTASYFQKNDSLPITMFPKNESATTTSVSMGTMPSMFSFGGQAPVQAQTEQSKFGFNFSSNKTESAPIFNTFGGSTDNNVSNNQFNIPSNSVMGGNAHSGNPLNTTTLLNTGNNLTTGNSLSTPPAPSIFGTTIQKENVWPANNNNMFATNTTNNLPQNPPTFTFGTATPFSGNNNAAFGAPQQAQPAQPTQNMFGITGQTNVCQPSMFGTHLQNQTPPNMFGAPQIPNNSMSVGMFGVPNTVPPNFGLSNPPIPTFETAPPPAPAPASFNFGGQPSTGIFGFGQQPQQMGPSPSQPDPSQQQVAQQPGMYNFGGPVVPAPHMQFTIGSAPTVNTGARRLRKAVRRTQR